jgi:hypothetical protein
MPLQDKRVPIEFYVASPLSKDLFLEMHRYTTTSKNRFTKFVDRTKKIATKKINPTQSYAISHAYDHSYQTQDLKSHALFSYHSRAQVIHKYMILTNKCAW